MLGLIQLALLAIEIWIFWTFRRGSFIIHLQCRRRDRLAYRHKSAAPEQQMDMLEHVDNFDDDLEAQRETKLEIYSSLPTRGSRGWFG